MHVGLARECERSKLSSEPRAVEERELKGHAEPRQRGERLGVSGRATESFAHQSASSSVTSNSSETGPPG